MMTAKGLATLVQRLDGRRVLSVYVDGRDGDPARRDRWRRILDADLDAIRAAVREGSRADLMEFERAAAYLEQAIALMPNAGRAPAWAAFVTSDAVVYAGPEAIDAATRADWRVGGRLAPLVRGLKEERPVIVAMVEARKATMFHYQNLELRRLDTLRALTRGDDVSPMPLRSPGRFHPGTRGRTGADAAADALRAGRERMYRSLAKRVLQSAGEEAWIVYGGAPEAAQAAFAELPATVHGRARVVPELGIASDAAAIAAAAAHAASLLRRARDERVVDQALERAGARGRGVSGVTATLDALAKGAVHELLLTPEVVEQHPEEAEALLERALAGNTVLEVVAGAGAERLNREGEGVAGILRYPMVGSAAALD